MVTRYNRIFKKDDCHFVMFIKMNKLHNTNEKCTAENYIEKHL